MERREKSFKSITGVFFCLALIWVILQFLAPVMLPAGSVGGLSGIVIYDDNAEITQEMGFPWNFVYDSGDRLCHQKEGRSLILNDNQMPFCARCTAIWIGLAIGLSLVLFYRIEIDEKLFALLFLCIAPLAVDGVGQLVGFWESTNTLRILTGLPAGFISGAVLGLIAYEFQYAFCEYCSKKRKKECT